MLILIAFILLKPPKVGGRIVLGCDAAEANASPGVIHPLARCDRRNFCSLIDHVLYLITIRCDYDCYGIEFVPFDRNLLALK